jgi:hypothetical protein
VTDRGFVDDGDVFDVSPSGASMTCRYCGTIYDRHWVDLSDAVPPLGDGCDQCSPFEDDEDEPVFPSRPSGTAP